MNNEPKHYPKPEYCKCNAGHQLVEVFNGRRNAFIWDCPTCIAKMQAAENASEQNARETEGAYADKEAEFYDVEARA